MKTYIFLLTGGLFAGLFAGQNVDEAQACSCAPFWSDQKQLNVSSITQTSEGDDVTEQEIQRWGNDITAAVNDNWEIKIDVVTAESQIGIFGNGY